MNIEEIREYGLSLPMVTEDMAFGNDHLLLRICDKIFLCMGLDRADRFAAKCDPEYALELRECHMEIEPAWHWNKRYWNDIRIDGRLSPEYIKSLIRHSYSEVVKKLPKKTLAEHPEILEVR